MFVVSDQSFFENFPITKKTTDFSELTHEIIFIGNTQGNIFHLKHFLIRSTISEKSILIVSDQIFFAYFPIFKKKY